MNLLVNRLTEFSNLQKAARKTWHVMTMTSISGAEVGICFAMVMTKPCWIRKWSSRGSERKAAQFRQPASCQALSSNTAAGI